jgi:hypothetical protein
MRDAAPPTMRPFSHDPDPTQLYAKLPALGVPQRL